MVVWRVNGRCDHQLWHLKFNTRPSHDHYTTSHNHRTTLWLRRTMFLIYIVRWRCATSCDLVRPSKIIFSFFLTIHYNSAWNRSQVFEHDKNSQDIGWWPLMATTPCSVARLHTIHPDGSRSPKFTHHRSSYDVVNTMVYMWRNTAMLECRRVGNIVTDVTNHRDMAILTCNIVNMSLCR